MKIGIYGDSFSTSHVPAEHFAWYNLLAKKLGGTIKTYGLGASSTFWSYKNFLTHHNAYDLNIFIASDALKYPKLVDMGGGVLKPISGINSLEWHTNLPTFDKGAKDRLEQIKSWILVSDEEFMMTAQELILQDIEKKGKTIILASELHTAFVPERIKKSVYDFGLWDVAKLVWNSLDIPYDKKSITLEEKQDKIAAHLTEEGNNLLADLLYQHITDGIVMTLPNHLPHMHKYDYYYGH